MHRRFSVFGIALLCLLRTAQAYGPVGHEIVGAIADERLEKTPTGKQVSALLQGLSLKKAAVIADEIKGWDKKTPDDPKAFHYRRRPELDAQLTAYWKANPPTKDPNSPAPSHHWFHYTEVPVVKPQKYEDGTVGRSKWDVVHMIGYCVDVLQGRIPEDNERKITKPIAVILLAHFVGDIHQPLHVGAQYFDKGGNVVDPAKDQSALEDEGGNTLTFKSADFGVENGAGKTRKFHVFWDLDTVAALLPTVPEGTTKTDRRAMMDTAEDDLVRDMAGREPSNWKAPSGVDANHYGYIWANDILPIAREAHERLVIKNVAPMDDEGRTVAAGEIEQKPGSAPDDYRKWAVEVVKEELHKAGWRLADLLEKSLSSPAPPKP